MILMITSRRDGHIEAVSRHLDERGARWIRLNTEDLPTNASISLAPTTGEGSIHLHDSDKWIDLPSVQGVWYRKPEPVKLSHLALEGGACDYVEAEFNEVLSGLYAELHEARWINNPFTTRIAHRKMLQLQVAKKVGFNVPATIITNDPVAALRFADDAGPHLAIKSLGALSVSQEVGGHHLQYGVFTRKITREELEEFQDKIQYLPTQIQQFVEKRCELRITCVGKKVFTCRIEPRPGEITADDCRFDIRSLRHSACEYPELHQRLHAYMQAFGLNFACFDFGITQSGDAVFFECNPNGQWLWVENLTGLPIGKAVAEELLGVAC